MLHSFYQHLFLTLVILLNYSPSAQADIFGSDDRRNPKTGSAEERVAKSVAVGVLESLLTQKENGLYDLFTDKMSDLVCPDERFSNEISIAYACTGFLIGPDLLLTAGHCSTNFEEVFNKPGLYCDAYTWMFDYIANAQGEVKTTNISPDKIFRCKQIIYAVSNDDKDFALIQLDRPAWNRDPIQISKKEVKVGDAVSMLGSPMGMPTKFTKNAKVIENTAHKNAFTTNLDAFEGNSGSPVFNDAHEAIGILIAGSPSDNTYWDPKTQCGRYNYCDENGENCVIAENDALDGEFKNGSDVEKLSKYRDVLESNGAFQQYMF